MKFSEIYVILFEPTKRVCLVNDTSQNNEMT